MQLCVNCRHYNKFNKTCRSLDYSKRDVVTGEYFNFPCAILRVGETCMFYQAKEKLVPPPTTETIKRPETFYSKIVNFFIKD